MSNPSFGSLFAGVGGIDLGFEKAGWKCSWQVEWDKKCQSVLSYIWPDTNKYFDVKDVNGAELEPVDLITFGSPCQDLSVAGKRAGLDGQRSSMFFEATRIIQEMRNATGNVYPKFAVWENVPGALTSNQGRDFAAVIDEMADIGALAIEWNVLDAQWFGIPHRRRRIFLIACFDLATVKRCGHQILPVPQDSDGSLKKSRKKRQQSARASETSFGEVVSPICGLNNKNTVDTNNLIKYDEDKILFGRTGHSEYTEGESIIAASTAKRPEENLVVHNPQPFVKIIRSGARDAEGNLPPEVWAKDNVSPTLNSFDNSGESRSTVLIVDLVLRRLTPIECERLMGMPDNHTKYGANEEIISDTNRYKMIGNAVAVPVAEWVGKHLFNLNNAAI